MIQRGTIPIETERTILRPFTPEDVSDLHEIFSDEETMRRCEPPYSLETTATFLEEFCIRRQGALACALKDTGKVIGYLLCRNLGTGDGQGLDDVYEVGWFFNRSYWRQGFACESMFALLAHLFEEEKAHKVFAETVDTKKSVALMKKLGMIEEGVQRKQARTNDGIYCDLYLYGLLREEYRPQGESCEYKDRISQGQLNRRKP